MATQNSTCSMPAPRLFRTVAALLLAAGTQAQALNLTWTNIAGGKWSATNNWSPNQTPGANDSAFITNAGAYTVTLNSNITVTNLRLGGMSGQQTLATTNFSLTLASAQSSLVDSNGVFLLQGGISTGNLTVNGQLDWTGGELGNSQTTLTVTTNGIVTLAGKNGANYTLGEYMTDSGTIRLQSGNLYIDWFDFWGQITNAPTGLVDVQADVSIDINANQGLITNLVNQGTVQKSGGTGTTSINAIFNNDGTLAVQTGTVLVNGTGSGGGLFEAEAGATLVFGDDYEVDGVLSGAGTNVIAAGTFTLIGSISTANTLLAGGTLMGDNGVLSGLVTWTNGALGDAFGTLTVATNGILVLAGVNGTDYTLGQYVTNSGTIRLQSGNLNIDWCDYFGQINNLTNGLVDMQADVSIDGCSLGLGLVNEGTVRKSGGTNVSGLNAVFSNSGTLDVQTGTVSVNGAYSLTGGTLNFGLNSLSNFGQVVLTGNPATLDGSVSANLNNGYVPGAGSSFAVVTFAAGSGLFTNAVLPLADAWQTNYSTNAFSLSVLNARPVLAPSNQVINEFTTLTAGVNAYDPNVPPETLVFSLLSGPSGLTMDPGTGIVSWTPAQTQSPSTNTVVVSAANNGTPPLAATNSFTVVVREVNVAPTLAGIRTQTINVNTTLIVTNNAIDPNLKATLSYALLNPPAGAAINAGGVITWTPTFGQGPSTNTFKTVVTATDTYDLVHPTVAVTNSFTVIVRLPIVLATAQWLGNGQFQFTFNTRAGVEFTLQYSTNLVQWTSVLKAQGDGENLTILDPNATGGARFYRVISP